MKKTRNRFIKNLRYLCLASVIILGLLTIIGTNGCDQNGGTTPPPDLEIPSLQTWEPHL